MAKSNKHNIDIAPKEPLWRIAPIAVTFLIFAIVGPQLFSAYWLNTMTGVSCLIMVASSVALLYGQLGMVSLAQFAMAGGGGWVCLRVIHAFGLPFELAVLVGGLASGVAGFFLSIPALRMRGLYLALLTLLLGAAFQVVINVTGFPDGGTGWLGHVLNGERTLIQRPVLAQSDGAYFRYVLVWLTLAMGWLEWQRATKPGRAWALIRKSEAAATAVGVSVVTYKAWAFSVAGFIAGMAGGLLAGLNGQLDNAGFPVSQSILLYALVVVGGAYHWMGAVIAGLLVRALPSLLNDHGVDGNLANVFFGFALLVSLIQGRKGLAGQLADFYKYVRMSRIVEGTAVWAVICCGLGLLLSYEDWLSFQGTVFIVFIALLFRMAIPGVCWLLLGFFGKRIQDTLEEVEGRASLALARAFESLGLTPRHRLIKNILNWAFIGFFVAWVAWGVFGVEYLTALALIWAAMAVKEVSEVWLYPLVLDWRAAIDKRFPKPLAAYR